MDRSGMIRDSVMKGRERSLLIIGAGGLGQDCADIATMMGRYTKIAFLDDAPTEEKMK